MDFIQETKENFRAHPIRAAIIYLLVAIILVGASIITIKVVQILAPLFIIYALYQIHKIKSRLDG